MGAPREAFERSAARWLRAFPPRWRRLHEDEVIGLLESVTPGDARRLPVSVAANLVRSGLAVRWRGRPDPLSWVLYRFFDMPIRTAMDWVADDIDGRWWPVRHLAMSWTLLVGAVLLRIGDPTPPALDVTIGVVLVGLAPVAGRLTRRRARRWHLLGTEPPPQRLA